MKTFRATRCQLIATVSLIWATVPLVGVGQEAVPNDLPAAAPPVAQVRYVSDKLVLNVYAEPAQGTERVATIQTGDVVEELERSGNMVRVRLESGREGWVGANYLTSDEPAAVRLRELQREQKAATRGADKEKALTAEIAALKKENMTLRGQVDQLKTAATTAPPPPPANDHVQIMTANAADVVSEQTMDGSGGGGPWAWMVAVILTGALGYASGYQTLARKLRRKFGGLKVY
ncbi:TIGR04211 family SH3 domain-containing protein [Steroidobacter sp. S1-65]|uniref:TIGR04211 family SH3 domain-containing protein n=1 Tax=Steroidobacter gossypii TaxID=2805490 RepID=A0ABS1WQM5_9GAMM|nr:TIGR04211 family SH3 domain-containing protein [Steroidobacter gossypii]MBM0103252.1 TIGR04211 family SH3 domain-containing protein [Steroidobacter gossypii]